MTEAKGGQVIGVPPPGGVNGTIHETTELATSVGPMWALILVGAILVLFPRWGLLPHLIQLIKEDRQDKRKIDHENKKLLARYQARADGRQSKPRAKKLPPGTEEGR